MQISNQKTSAPGSSAPGSIQLTGDSIHIHGSSTANLREVTTLEKCRNQAMSNMYAINDLGSRVVALLDRCLLYTSPSPRD